MPTKNAIPIESTVPYIHNPSLPRSSCGSRHLSLSSHTHTHERRMNCGSKQEGPKLFSSRILSRDRSNVANESFRVYYSLGAGTVPFVWEPKPGTPKSAVTPASATTMPPPISPPPSYQSKSHESSKVRKCGRKTASSWTAGGWISWPNFTSGGARGRRHQRITGKSGLHWITASMRNGGPGVLHRASELVW
jgi:hypothetical protein